MKATQGKIALTALAIFLPLAVHASDSHYVPGIEGIKGSVAPPPGIYYKGYLINYSADESEALPSDSEVKVTALANRAVWVTQQKLLGGDLILEAIIPLVSTNLKIGGQDIDRRTGLGDLYVGSALGWHDSRWDAVAGVGYWADTGDFDKNRFSSPGKGYDSVMLTLGGNVKLTKQGDINFSALSRYEMPNGDSLNDELIIEWGLSKSYGSLDIGLVGYNTFETGDGDEERNALGLSVGYFSPPNLLGGDIALYKEYSNKETFEGEVIRASLTKVF